MLAALDADVIAFQEVFSTEDFKALMQAQGYPHLAILEDAPVFPAEPGAPVVFAGPVNALASRHPIISARLLPARPAIEPDGLLSDKAGFRRGIIEAEVEIPGLPLPLIVYACHFKSQGARVDEDAVEALEGWDTRWRAHFRERARRDANQVIRRVGEAMMLYDAVLDRLEANPDRPIAVMGDLNAAPDSNALRILTQEEEVRYIANQNVKALEQAERAQMFPWKLYPCSVLGSPQRLAPPPTHASSHHASQLDYILVSNALNRNNRNAPAYCRRFDVFNDHHWEERDRNATSDHAPVRARFEIRE
jgi:endonuclease/exonuclease/phosphatase family metal-dependent hydrolase